MNVEVDNGWGDCLGAWDTTVLVRVKGPMVTRMVDCVSCDRQFEEGLPICLLYMNDTKAMDLLISRFLLDKHVVNCEPSVERDTMFDAKVDDVGYEMEDFLRS